MMMMMMMRRRKEGKEEEEEEEEEQEKEAQEEEEEEGEEEKEDNEDFLSTKVFLLLSGKVSFMCEMFKKTAGRYKLSAKWKESHNPPQQNLLVS
jgi:hypothetical protein